MFAAMNFHQKHFALSAISLMMFSFSTYLRMNNFTCAAKLIYTRHNPDSIFKNSFEWFVIFHVKLIGGVSP